ncbi:MAG: glycine--tRNA ligase [Candidatus Pacebacteria bacterium]|nr:glycine--tRNA ligase [Candidatus Paceibacterota bacterium]
MPKNNLLEKITALCKRRGFIFPSSGIYGGIAGIYDYGPLGVALAKNIKDLWWQDMVEKRTDMYGLDGSILMHPRSWEASGHVAGFTDPLVDCGDCQKRFRPDKLEGWKLKKDNQTGQFRVIKTGSLKCPVCGGRLIAKVRQFNVLMETSLGAIEGEKMKAYLKGESCQNIYLDFIDIVNSFSPKLPFGIAQIGKAFRNEITLGKFIFKTREFEQFDIEYFTRPQDSTRFYREWKKIRWDWYRKRLGLKEKNLRWRQHDEDERIFYAKDAWDIDYFYPWGWDELEGVHDRSDYDLTQHAKFSGKKLDIPDQETNQRIVPFIVECSGGVGRTMLAVLLDAYREEEGTNGIRVFLSLDVKIAPYKVAVFPLLANKAELIKKARSVYENLKDHFRVTWDEIGNIGKRYRRQDEAGTPWCVTIDYQSLKDEMVTVRDRDTMAQKRLAVARLADFFKKKLNS